MSLATRLGIQINHPPRAGDAPAATPAPRPAPATPPAARAPDPAPSAPPRPPAPDFADEPWTGGGLEDSRLPSRMLPALAIGAAAAVAGLIVVLRRRR